MVFLLENILELTLLKSRDFVFFTEKILNINIGNTQIILEEHINSSTTNTIEKTLEKNTFELYLLEKIIDQPIKIKAIKIIRDIIGVELRAAKELIDKAPIAIKKDLSKAEAEDLFKKCEVIGAKFEIR